MAIPNMAIPKMLRGEILCPICAQLPNGSSKKKPWGPVIFPKKNRRVTLRGPTRKKPESYEDTPRLSDVFGWVSHSG